MEIYIKELKMCKKTKHKYHSTQAQRREAQSLEHSRPRWEEKNDKPKSKHHQSVQYLHRPILEDQRRQHDETRLKVAHLVALHVYIFNKGTYEVLAFRINS